MVVRRFIKRDVFLEKVCFLNILMYGIMVELLLGFRYYVS